MHRIRFLLALVLVAVLSSVGLQAEASTNTGIGKILWQTYIDPRYDFSLEYPAGWTVIPRDDQEDSYGGVLTFADPASETQIVIGLYTLERSEGQSLAEWTEFYQEESTTFKPSEIKIEKTETIPLAAAGNVQAHAVVGISPLTGFQFTNIPRGRTVWFIWTNGDVSTTAIYARVRASFKFGPNTPSTLKDAFGPIFQPKPRHPLKSSTARSGNKNLLIPSFVVGLPDTSWKVPTPGGNVSYTVNCGSSFHTGTAAYATDVSMVTNTKVYSAKRSWVDFAGWDNTGYGNLMKTNTDFIYARPYILYYAHLSSFVISVGNEAWTSRHIAYSGSTGTKAAHLHFHVVSLGEAVNVAGLITFAENSNYPSVYAQCGTMYRQ